MKDLKIRARRGFTLIELVVVIAILGILAGLAIPRFLDATATARGARIVADMRTIDSAIVIYNAKTGSLPTITGTDYTVLTSDDNANGKYQLLAAWPVPPTGTAKITNNAGKTVTITPTATAYSYGGTTGTNAGRALYGTLTVDGILALTGE